MELLGSSAVVASSAGIAGCSGPVGGGSGGSDAFQSEIENVDFTGKGRRRASLGDWPYRKRKQVPTGDARSKASAWIDSGSVKSAPWTPPPGWEDTVAADVDEIQILNYGDMGFDPATAAVDALFEDRTGITMKRVQVVLDQAIPKAAAFLSQKQESPHMLQSTVSSSMSTYAGAGWLQPVDAIMPEEGMWDMYLPMLKQTYNWNGHLWGGPGTLEGVPMNVRVDLLKEQGLDAELRKIREGTWTWADLESVMAAFEGTDVYGFGFRGGSRVDAERDWRMLWYQTGGQYVTDGKVSVDPNGGGLIALRKLVEWKENGWLPPSSVNWGEGDLVDAFLSGDLALASVATDIVGSAREEFDAGDYVIARPPKADRGPAPRHATYGGGPVSAINAFAPLEYKVAGTLFQDCRFSEAASWWEYVEEGNMAPAKATYRQAEQHDAVWMSGVRGQVMQDARNEVFPQQRAITQNTSEEIQRAYAGEKSPKKALQDAQSFIDTVLGQ